MGNNIKKLRKDEITKYYEIGGKLGTGSFAVVKQATRKADGKQFAIKIIKKSKLNAEELAVVHDEVEIMHKVDHPNCVKLFEMFETSKKLYMVLELLTGGELFDRIVAKGSYSEKEASALIRDISGAIKYLHSIGVVHRDLKPENLLYLSPKPDAPIKITDFGLAKIKGSSDTLMSTACGTPGYVAPEVLKNEPYDRAVDMWSLGVILYILLCGFPPFYHENTSQLYKQIKKGEYDFPDPYWTDISAEAKNLVSLLLTVNPKKRITAEGVLAHPWIVGQISEKKFQSSHNDRLRQLQARRKLRRGVQMVLAVNKFSSLFRDPSTGSTSSNSSASSASHATPAPRQRVESKGGDSDDD
jgi:calcium/calmodulin-dependent protein kinase I